MLTDVCIGTGVQCIFFVQIRFFYVKGGGGGKGIVRIASLWYLFI
jgi:hypothetical protein